MTTPIKCQYLAVAVRTDSPLNSGREFVDRLKRDPYSFSTGINSAGSAQQIAFWHRVLAASVATPEWKAFIEANQWEAEYLNSADYTRYLRAEDAKLMSALIELGLAKQ